MFENLRRIFCDEIFSAEQMKKQKATVEKEPAVALTVNDKVRFKSDIEALEKEFGTLKQGQYELSLTRALEIMPRDRKRVDAYGTLIKYLKERGITLIIESRKTKNNGVSEKN